MVNEPNHTHTHTLSINQSTKFLWCPLQNTDSGA